MRHPVPTAARLALLAALACGGSGPPPGPPEATFAGSATCAGCHPLEAAAWAGSDHATAWTMGEPAPGDHETGVGSIWGSRCAPCHGTDVVVGWDDGEGRYDSRIGEHAVGCEACHGSGSRHAAGFGSMPRTKPGLERCYGCHSQRVDLLPDARLSGGDLARYAPELVDGSATFWPDGQAREEVLQVNAFLGSAHHEHGVACGDCHEPHGGGLRAAGDAACLGCHRVRPRYREHDHHGGAVRCVDCHLPVTADAQGNQRHDHGVVIPDPAFRGEHGIPDPCTTACHQDRSGAWAGAALARWDQDVSDRPHRLRILAVEGPRSGDVAPILAMLDAETHPTWRGIAAGLLGPWFGRGDVQARVVETSGSASMLARYAAVAALPEGHLELARHLGDPALAVRVRAQQRLMTTRGPRDPSMGELRTWLEANLDQPGPAATWGAWLAAHGDPRGLQVLVAAEGRWPGDPAVAVALARRYTADGRVGSAVAVLRRATDLRPGEPVLWTALGEALAAGGDEAGAAEARSRGAAIGAAEAREPAVNPATGARAAGPGQDG